MLEEVAAVATNRGLRDGDLAALIGLSARLARAGCGQGAVELALSRKGLRPDAARLIAASVVSCRTALAAAQTPSSAQLRARHADVRAARAAQRMLSKLIFLPLCIAVGAGGGALMGWAAGFDAGVEDGTRWVVSALLQLASL
jgi:hypothetical protein